MAPLSIRKAIIGIGFGIISDLHAHKPDNQGIENNDD